MLSLSLLQSSVSLATGDRRSKIEKHVVISVRSNLTKKVQQSFLNQSLDPPVQNSWIRPCQPTNKHYLKWPNERPGHLFNLRPGSKRGCLIDRRRLKERRVYSHNCDKLNKSNMPSAKILSRSSKPQHRCQNASSGLLCCHCESIPTLNLILDKMKYAKPC